MPPGPEAPQPAPKVPFRTVGQAGASTGSKTGSGGGMGSGAQGSGPKVPYRQVSGTKAASQESPDQKGPDQKGPGQKAPGQKGPDQKDPKQEAPLRTPGFKGTGSKVTVTVDDDHLDDVEGLAEKLRAEGLEVDQVLGDVGIITGSVPSDKRESVGGVEGVAAVEDETTFQLPSPEAGIQ